MFQQLISDLDLKRRLSRCFEHQKGSPSFSTTSIVLVLIISVWLGYRRLRDVQFFKDDPIVLRFLGLHQMPTVSTISRQLGEVDDRSIDGIERLQQNLVIEALVREQLATITLDFDGSVLGTCRHAEGVANGFNKKRKASAATIPCTAPLRKQRKCSLFTIVAAMCTTAMAPGSSLSNVWKRSKKPVHGELQVHSQKR